jgi:hypothetical protein
MERINAIYAEPFCQDKSEGFPRWIRPSCCIYAAERDVCRLTVNFDW